LTQTNAKKGLIEKGKTTSHGKQKVTCPASPLTFTLTLTDHLFCQLQQEDVPHRRHRVGQVCGEHVRAAHGRAHLLPRLLRQELRRAHPRAQAAAARQSAAQERAARRRPGQGQAGAGARAARARAVRARRHRAPQGLRARLPGTIK